MKLIIITPSNIIDDEHYILGRMLDMGLPTLYVRKPKLSSRNLKKYLKKFTKNQQKKIIVYRYFTFLWKFDLKGIHVSKKQRLKKTRFLFSKAMLRSRRRNFTIGTSCKSFASLDETYKDFDYLIISPVFANPHGHQASFNPATLKRIIPTYPPGKVIARGGATLNSVNEAKEIGFSGIAFQRHIWNNTNPLLVFQKILDRFHELGLPVE